MLWAAQFAMIGSYPVSITKTRSADEGPLMLADFEETARSAAGNEGTSCAGAEADETIAISKKNRCGNE